MLHRTERQILKQIKEGKTEAFESFVNLYYKSVYSLLAYLTGDKNLAEDLTQETFTCAWTGINAYKGNASLKTWLYRIAYNKFVDSERKVRQTSAFMSGLTEKNCDTQGNSEPFSEITKDEHSRILFDAMRKLDPADYAVIVLHYIQDFSYREMAVVLKEPVGTIKWRTSRAINKLKEILTGRI